MSNAPPPRKDPEQPWRAEGTPEGPRRSGGGGLRGGKWWGLLVPAGIVFLLGLLGLNYLGQANQPTISYTEFSRQVSEGNVATIYSKGDAIQGQLKTSRSNPEGGGKYTRFK